MVRKTSVPRPATKNPRKPKSAPIADDGTHSETTPPPRLLDKPLVLQLVLAKLEASKTCDWFELARNMSGEPKVGSAIARKAGKKGKAASEWTGTELHDLYHHLSMKRANVLLGQATHSRVQEGDTILPALKSGRALWAEDADVTIMDAATPDEHASSDGYHSAEADMDDGTGKADEIPPYEEGEEELDITLEIKPVKKAVKKAATSKPKAKLKKATTTATKKAKNDTVGTAKSYRQSIIGKTNVNTKRVRPAYDEEEDDDMKGSGGSADELLITDANGSDKVKGTPAVSPTSSSSSRSGRRRSGTKAAKYVDDIDVESEEDDGELQA